MSEDQKTEEAPRRNEIFAGQTPQRPMAPTAPQRDEFGFVVPTESVPLPSNGKVYPEGHPLHMATSVDIKAMTAREEDILTSRALAKNGTVITQLLRSCIVDKRIDPASLISGDRNAIMVAIRITGYGREYEVAVQCPDCEEKSDYKFDLAQLPVKRLTIDPLEPGKNVFEFNLPRSQARVQWRFMTGRDEEDLTQSATAKKKAKLAVADDAVTGRLLKMVVGINGNTDKNVIARALPNMPSQDSKAFREHIQENEPGIEMVGLFTCPACGESTEVDVPFGASFFWPSSKRP